MARPGCHLCWTCERPILYRDWVTLTVLTGIFPEQEWHHAACLNRTNLVQNGEHHAIH